jgi:hypothetical protein
LIKLFTASTLAVSLPSFISECWNPVCSSYLIQMPYLPQSLTEGHLSLISACFICTSPIMILLSSLFYTGNWFYYHPFEGRHYHIIDAAYSPTTNLQYSAMCSSIKCKSKWIHTQTGDPQQLHWLTPNSEDLSGTSSLKVRDTEDATEKSRLPS